MTRQREIDSMIYKNVPKYKTSLYQQMRTKNHESSQVELVARYWSKGHRTAMERELVDNGTCRRHAFPCDAHRGHDITAAAPTCVLPIRGPWQLPHLPARRPWGRAVIAAHADPGGGAGR
jgi:hypothetical protein